MAKASQAQYVVSENTRDFPLRQTNGHARYEGIEYLSGDAFLHLIAGTTLD